ncbi:MAG: DEAD/DEAH box helicase family protein [Candidatus Thorarchaeota archaeon]
MSEHETRKQLIDRKIEHAGWGLLTDFDANQVYKSETVIEYQTANGPADYVLFHNGKPLAIVEAKKLAVGPQNVLKQAQRYARGISPDWWEFGEYRVPFIYSTNGEVIWFQDLRDANSRSREVKQFHTPQALLELLTRGNVNTYCWLQENSRTGKERLRNYQKSAVEAIEEQLCNGKRKMMVAMATGTGKTFTAISLIYRLMKSGFAKRILFLVDRRALAAQAAGAMAVFEPEPGLKFDKIYEVYSQRFRRDELDDSYKFDISVLPNHYLTSPDPNHSFVYVCTIQRMRINLFGLPEDEPETGDLDIDEEAAQIDIPIHAFDLIIADECHRGYTAAETSKWREVLEHFDAVQIGLTATPAMHSLAHFTDVVYRYTYEQAVSDQFLVDYDAIRISSNIRMNGVFLDEGEGVVYIDSATGARTYDHLEDERVFEAAQVERDVTSTDSNRKIVKEFAKHAFGQEKQLGRFPKTLVFAVNDIPHTSHADTLVDMLRDEFGRGDAFVEKITGKADRPLRLIRQFRNRPQPGIVVTVDMLSTGVDIPALENILFVRPVKSRILFEQMMGRGTRLCMDLLPQKDHFTVYDAVGIIDYMNASAFTENPPSKPSRTFAQIVQDVLDSKERDYNIRLLQKRLLRVAKNITLEGREILKPWIPDGDIGKFSSKLPDSLLTNFAETARILSDPDFQNAIQEFERNPKVFIEAPEAIDTVTSEYLFKTTDGRALKPDEYLKIFDDYVTENPDQVAAIQILFNRPREFNTTHLTELRKALESRPERFTEKSLSHARRMKQPYVKELADIISLIREAVYEDDSTPDERAYEAIHIIREQLGDKITPEQEEWLELIRSYLPINLIISREDFRVPPFSRKGGWSKADRIFDGKLEDILQGINEVMLAWTSMV